MSVRKTRGRASTIDTLPDDIKKNLHELLRDKATTQEDILELINELLEQAGVEKRISRSALNRYATKMEASGARIREAREVAKAWTAQLGDKPTGEVSQIMIEMLRSLAFDLTINTQAEKVSPKFLKEISLSIQRLESAAEMSARREKEIRKAYEQEASQKVEQAVQERGLNKEEAEYWRGVIAGFNK